jgi:ubiquinone/menaquinone biosynthesis C-methylase UbiE
MKRILDLFGAFQSTDALRTALGFRLFTLIAEGVDTTDLLAARCQAHPRGMRILSDYLCTLDLLEKLDVPGNMDGRYRCTEDSARWLVQTSPQYLGAAAEFRGGGFFRACFAALPDAVRKGGVAIDEEGSVSRENELWEQFALGMLWTREEPARRLASLVKPPQRVLDVASGHGMFGIAIAQQFPGATIVAQDWANILPACRRNAERFGVGDRWEELPGSAFEVELRGRFDLIILGHFLHHFPHEENVRLLQRMRAALTPDGELAIVEYVPHEDRVTPKGEAAFALTMLATTPAGDAYTERELQAMWQEAGFAEGVLHRSAASPQSILLLRG